MNVAFLFNCNDPEYGGYYGGPIRDKILATGILQKTGRHMRVCIGDVLTYGRCKTINQLRSVYRPHSWDKRKRKSLEATHNKATVFCWLFQNIKKDVAEQLDHALRKERSYLGALDINFTYIPHFCFFKNGMIEKYRLHDRKCATFYSMGQNEDPDIYEKQAFEQNGLVAYYEDSAVLGSKLDKICQQKSAKFLA